LKKLAAEEKIRKLSLEIGEGLPTWRETDIRRKELRIFACFPLHKRQADLLRASAGGYCVWLKIQVRG